MLECLTNLRDDLRRRGIVESSGEHGAVVECGLFLESNAREEMHDELVEGDEGTKVDNEADESVWAGVGRP